jgi:hypothetical protein
MFYQYSYATCFDHNFGHHQALNKHMIMMIKIVVETCNISKLYIKKCCADAYNINNVIFYT